MDWEPRVLQGNYGNGKLTKVDLIRDLMGKPFPREGTKNTQ